jgi:hypothetical protein
MQMNEEITKRKGNTNDNREKRKRKGGEKK